MAQIQAVQCDACERIDKPAEDASIPEYWLLVDIHEEGVGNLDGRVFCSWACLGDVAQRRAAPPKVKRKRRTREEMAAERAKARPAPAPVTAASA